MPVGFIGLMVGGLIAANSSTILTHLNWGASYLVHDFYQRFLRKDATEKHYVMVGRVATALLFFASSALVYALDTAKDNFDIILQIGAGTAALHVALVLVADQCLVRGGRHDQLLWRFRGLAAAQEDVRHSVRTAQGLMITIAVTTVCWLLAAYLAPQTDRRALIEFYKKVVRSVRAGPRSASKRGSRWKRRARPTRTFRWPFWAGRPAA